LLSTCTIKTQCFVMSRSAKGFPDTKPLFSSAVTNGVCPAGKGNRYFPAASDKHIGNRRLSLFDFDQHRAVRCLLRFNHQAHSSSLGNHPPNFAVCRPGLYAFFRLPCCVRISTGKESGICAVIFFFFHILQGIFEQRITLSVFRLRAWHCIGIDFTAGQGTVHLNRHLPVFHEPGALKSADTAGVFSWGKGAFFICQAYSADFRRVILCKRELSRTVGVNLKRQFNRRSVMPVTLPRHAPIISSGSTAGP